MNEAQPRESHEPDLPAIRTKPSAADSFGSAGNNRVDYPSEATAQTVGNLALKPQADVLEFKPKATPKLEAVPEVNGEKQNEKSLRQYSTRTKTGDGLSHNGNVPSKPVAERKVSKNRNPIKPKPVKTESTKEEADWLKRSFPANIPDASGSWNVRTDCAGFNVYYRIDKRQNNGEPINLKFPRISREMFLTLKGLSDVERKATVEKYVRGHLGKAVRSGDDRARTVAGKLCISS